jgi:hypothetical protein
MGDHPLLNDKLACEAFDQPLWPSLILKINIARMPVVNQRDRL